MRIGVIADTHLPALIRSLDDLGPTARALLETVDLILHAGDVIAPSVVAWCEQFAPVRIARGNNDLFEHPNLHDRHVFEAQSWHIGLVHELRPESRPIQELLADGLDGEQVDILIAGDTHVQRLELRDDVVLLNPGSPTLPHHKESRLGTAAILDLTPERLDAQIVLLGETPNRPNPGRAQRLTVHKGIDGAKRRA
jgi:uncharacterized protein